MGLPRPNNLEMPFEELFKTISEEGKKNQSPKNSELVDLPGKDQFQKIIGDKDTNLKWKLISQKGKNCYSDTKGHISFCGYIELVSNDTINTTYKLRVRYETKTNEGSKDSGQVNVIRKDNSAHSATHYCLGDSGSNYRGNSVTGSLFDNFVSWEKTVDGHDEGLQLQGHSIKQEV